MCTSSLDVTIVAETFVACSVVLSTCIQFYVKGLLIAKHVYIVSPADKALGPVWHACMQALMQLLNKH